MDGANEEPAQELTRNKLRQPTGSIPMVNPGTSGASEVMVPDDVELETKKENPVYRDCLDLLGSPEDIRNLEQKLNLLISGDASSETLSIKKLIEADQDSVRAYRRVFDIGYKSRRATVFSDQGNCLKPDGTFDSPNTLGWLEETEQKNNVLFQETRLSAMKARKQLAQDYMDQCELRGVSRARIKVLTDDMGSMDLEIEDTAKKQEFEEGDVILTWSFVFEMADDVNMGGRTVDVDDDDEDMDSGDQDSPTRRLSHECYMLCEKLWKCSMFVTHRLTANKDKIIIMVGMPHETMVEEAQLMKIRMRMQETKGALEFNASLMNAFSRNHGGLNEYTVEGFRDREQYADGNSWISDLDCRLLLAEEQRIFTSAHAQRLAVHRLDRLMHYDAKDVITMDTVARQRESLWHTVRTKGKVSGRTLHQLLVAHGGDRPHNETVFSSEDDLSMQRTALKEAEEAGEDMDAEHASLVNVVAKFVAVVYKDPHLVLSKDGLASRYPDLSFDYSDLEDLLQTLDAWADPEHGAGRQEAFCGTLLSYFPMHDDSELAYLSAEWGSFGCIKRVTITGYNAEGEPAVIDRGPPQIFDVNTFGSTRNRPHEHSLPWLWFYQPTEEIRDYFGDDVGLYCEWLSTYTKALGVNSILGIIVIITQLFYNEGVDGNPLTIYFSIYVGLWSVSFLEAWHRRENELRFLWGNENLSTTESVRLEFVGRLEINAETGREEMVRSDVTFDMIKKFVSFGASFLFILFTIASAIFAMTLRYVPVDPNGGLVERYKWEMISAVVNLAVITIYGLTYEKLADILSDFENHRTEAEYDNALVLKNFVFQFINNYFVLFYIAYGRESPDPFSNEAHPCERGTCLDELQFQLFVVFTAKTFGKQIAYTAKPFVTKVVNTFLNNRAGQKMLHKIEEDVAKLGMAAVHHASGPPKEKIALSKFEIEAQKMPYPSTFLDFNDRVIQFGYLVLFAPALPLAPLFAFINNVIEIRAFGVKMCKAYQRPVWRARTGIGAWLGVLNALGFLAVVTNASMIAFVGSHQAAGVHWGANSKYAGDTYRETYPHCVVDYVQPPGLNYTVDKRDCPGFFARLQVYQLWFIFILFEHGVMILRVFVLVLSPAVPAWLTVAHETREYRMKKVYQKSTDEIDFHEQSWKQSGANKELVDKAFARLDTDGDGSISRAEFDAA